MLNNRTKYVASRTLQEPLPWKNSTLLKGDAAEAVATLKKQPGGDLMVIGSGELVQSLMRSNLIDEYIVLIHALNVVTPSGVIAIGSSLASVWAIATLLPTLAVTVRRLRDAGRRWTELFWLLVPIAGAVVLIVHLCQPSKAEGATA